MYVADDDKNICNILKSQLQSENYKTEEFLNGQDLLNRFKEKPCELIITDIMMPNMSGYELCRAIRDISNVPIIMISAKDEEIDKILGLELGSDDYISKPFSLREVTIKARNMLRRANNHSFNTDNTDEKLILKDLEIIKSRRAILIHGQELKVTAKEYELLELLIENKNKPFSRESIIEKVWGYDYYGDTRQVDHLIKRLRKKMLLEGSECKIETLWGYGYKVSD
ncbi:response regulator transcription factor [Romboutsia sedimentorum]|nr:response regulator transcription factor [Romboutsia sedimentorum]MDK2587229.1 response regulator transcription factor [Romboutsia sedimentorum]